MYQNKENSYTDARITTTLLEFVSAKTDSHAAVIVSDQHKTYYAQLSLLTVHYHLSHVKHVNKGVEHRYRYITSQFFTMLTQLHVNDVVPNWWYNRRNSNVAVYVVYLVLDDNVLNQDSISAAQLA